MEENSDTKNTNNMVHLVPSRDNAFPCTIDDEMQHRTRPLGYPGSQATARACKMCVSNVMQDFF
jgi:hypothetical protein